MTLLPKPKREDFLSPNQTWWYQAERDYYKARAELAEAALAEISVLTNSAVDCPRVASHALAELKANAGGDS